MKGVLCGTFIFDKNGDYAKYVSLIMTILYGILASMRLKTGIIIDKNVNRATGSQEVFIFWLYLCVAIHSLTSTAITVSILLSIISLGFIVTFFAIYLGEKRVS